jgi:hypothetical protein
MTPSERTLRALRVLVQFEIAEAAGSVARATRVRDRAQSLVNTLAERCASAADGLRAAEGEARMNPKLIGAIHRILRLESIALRESRVCFDAASLRERQARAALAGVRNRERSLERALSAERRKQRLAWQAREAILDDELWLQHAWRGSTAR